MTDPTHILFGFSFPLSVITPELHHHLLILILNSTMMLEPDVLQENW